MFASFCNLGRSLTAKSFACDPAFDLGHFAALTFGSFHYEAEYGVVVWRFSPAVAAVDRQFIFHPDQQLTEEEDGALTVRREASGHPEMMWHLYQWGNHVEVIAPARLREVVAAYRRRDFPALP